MLHGYLAFGLSILSNRPISYLAAAPNLAEADVVVEFRYINENQAKADGADWDFGYPKKPGRDVGVDVFHNGDRQKLRVFRPDGRYFEFIATPDKVTILIPEDISDMDPVSFLLGPVLSVVCRLRNQSCLHASVLAIGGRAFALVGDKGMGKSTTAAMLIKLGAQFVADDAAILFTDGNNICVQPGYPYMRLSPEVMALTDHSHENATPVLSIGDKYYVPAYSKPDLQKFFTGPLPLDKIYSLSGRVEQGGEIRIEPTKQAQALRHLIGNAQVPYVMNDRMRRNDFKHFARFAREGRVMSTTRPDNLNQLELFCKDLIHNFRGDEALG